MTLPEDPTNLEKQNAYFTMLNGLMKDLGENLETGIQSHMANFITTAPVYGVTAIPAKPLTGAQEQQATDPISSGEIEIK